ncbi:B3 domain-containing protein [Quillaja saponaria]|uniref:B3 domain-containing protein n=1 Tax=Quillaja saponaria TaxID=32244 RepID=A0AAD7PTV5_QUISA|nr:B3 domain-containing protein [Quillaja saponaria]KAJ7966675.1 B3 domain-containing protein [Quillaja saponaria]
MAETCKSSRSLPEEIYWNHFKFIRFTQFLGSDYHKQLALPKKFSDNMKKKLPENVTLKGPSGMLWNLQLTTKDDTLFFSHGWQQFVKDHCLEDTDFLNFMYNDTEHESGGPSKRKQKEISLEELHNPSNSGVRCTEPEKSGNSDSIPVPSRFVPFEDTNNKIKKLVSSINPLQTTQKDRHTEAFRGDMSKSADAEPSSKKRKGTYAQLYTSNRRPVTEVEKRNALQLAEAALTAESFSIVIRPSHAYKRFFVFLPKWWTLKHMSPQNQGLILRIGEEEWCTRYTYDRYRRCGGFTGGWRYFAIDNNLEEFDVCVFKPACQMNNSMVLDVSIFRVVEEVTRLLPVVSGKQRGRKKTKT